MSRRDWIRVRSAWWTDPDHAELSGGARLLGPALMWIADGDPTWRETGAARLLDSAGAPLGLSQVARRVGVRLREVRRWVAELLAVGTLGQDDAGAYFFPNYRKHQENPSAQRVRKHRAKAVTVTQPVTPHVTTEAEAEAEAETPPPTPSGGTPSLAGAVYASSGVLAEIDHVRREVEAATGKKIGGLTRRIEKLDGLGTAVDDCGLAEVLEIVRHRCNEVATGRVDQKLWRRMFTGDGFHAAREAWQRDQDRSTAEAERRRLEAEETARLKAGRLTSESIADMLPAHLGGKGDA